MFMFYFYASFFSVFVFFVLFRMISRFRFFPREDGVYDPKKHPDL